MARVYLSLGSNLGDRLEVLRAAVERLRATTEVSFVEASRLYETEPWESEPGEPLNQRHWYLNCAVVIETVLPPERLLQQLQAIESALGRTRPAGTIGARGVQLPEMRFDGRRQVLRPVRRLPYAAAGCVPA